MSRAYLNGATRHSMFNHAQRNIVTKTNARKLPYKNNPTLSGMEQTFYAAPFPGETRQAFKSRVQTEVSAKLLNQNYANHELIIWYPTRIARENERAVNFFRQKKSTGDLPCVEKTILTGHCLLTFINETGNADFENTISLRPDMKKPHIYKATVAPDKRLPKAMMEQPTIVRPAMHTTVFDEIGYWAEDAYYANYIHEKRPNYPLHSMLRPIKLNEQDRYFAAIQDLKLMYQRYSLLDHTHPHTGEIFGDVVTSQNCTVIIKLYELLTLENFKSLLGDNPTPQLVMETIKNVYLNTGKNSKNHSGIMEVIDGDELSQRYERNTM